MKKLISMLVIFSIMITSILPVHALNDTVKLVSINEIEQYGFSTEINELIRNKVENGAQIYHGEGTTSPDYLNDNLKTRAIPTSAINLPANVGSFNFNMNYGNVYYSPTLYRATSSCTMKFHYSCTINYDPCNINVQIVDKTTDKVIFNEDLYANVDGFLVPVSLTATHEYYFVVTPLDPGRTYASFVVVGQ